MCLANPSLVNTAKCKLPLDVCLENPDLLPLLGCSGEGLPLQVCLDFPKLLTSPACKGSTSLSKVASAKTTKLFFSLLSIFLFVFVLSKFFQTFFTFSCFQQMFKRKEALIYPSYFISNMSNINCKNCKTSTVKYVKYWPSNINHKKCQTSTIKYAKNQMSTLHSALDHS